MVSIAYTAMLKQMVGALHSLKEVAPILRLLVPVKKEVFRAAGVRDGRPDSSDGEEDRRSAEGLSAWSGIPQSVRSLEEQSARMRDLLERISGELNSQSSQNEELVRRLARLEEALAETNQRLRRQAQYFQIAAGAVGAFLVISALIR